MDGTKIESKANRYTFVWQKSVERELKKIKENSKELLGEGRNSHSKTDPDATFMHMKDDHMRNGQLKPGYNVQFAVNSEFVVGIGVYPNRTDYATLPLLLGNRSIQAKGAFGQLKHNRGFVRFLTGGKVKALSELYLLGLSQNLLKVLSKYNRGKQELHLLQPKSLLKF